MSAATSATLPAIHAERRNATPMRLSSASTSSSVSSARRGGMRLIGHLDHRFEDGTNIGDEATLALQLVDHDRLRRAVGRGIAHAMHRDRGIARVVVGFVACMGGAVQRGLLL